jgi:hypothetical protein
VLDFGDGYVKMCSNRLTDIFFGSRKSSFGRRRSGGVGHKVVTKEHRIPDKPKHTSHRKTTMRFFFFGMDAFV